MTENNLTNFIVNTKQLIFEIDEKLIQDNWEECKPIIYNIIDNLSHVLSEISKVQYSNMIEIQNLMISVIDSIIKAVDFHDTIQLADLLRCDMIQLFDEIEKSNIE